MPDQTPTPSPEGLSPEVVERAAEALYLIRGARLDAWPIPTWDALEDLDRSIFRTDAGAAMTAAGLPDLLRENERLRGISDRAVTWALDVSGTTHQLRHPDYCHSCLTTARDIVALATPKEDADATPPISPDPPTKKDHKP